MRHKLRAEMRKDTAEKRGGGEEIELTQMYCFDRQATSRNWEREGNVDEWIKRNSEHFAAESQPENRSFCGEWVHNFKFPTLENKRTRIPV
jgi:hypothetical protein